MCKDPDSGKNRIWGTANSCKWLQCAGTSGGLLGYVTGEGSKGSSQETLYAASGSCVEAYGEPLQASEHKRDTLDIYCRKITLANGLDLVD